MSDKLSKPARARISRLKHRTTIYDLPFTIYHWLVYGFNVVSDRGPYGNDHAGCIDFRVWKHDSLYLGQTGPGRGSSSGAVGSTGRDG